jgi:hypothetical protein
MHRVMVSILFLLGDQNPPCARSTKNAHLTSNEEEALFNSRASPVNPGADHVKARPTVSSVYTVCGSSSPGSMEDAGTLRRISAIRGGTAGETVPGSAPEKDDRAVSSSTEIRARFQPTKEFTQP